jgi:hypothetical protein
MVICCLPIEIVDLPNEIVDFPISFSYVYQAGYPFVAKKDKGLNYPSDVTLLDKWSKNATNVMSGSM